MRDRAAGVGRALIRAPQDRGAAPPPGSAPAAPAPRAGGAAPLAEVPSSGRVSLLLAAFLVSARPGAPCAAPSAPGSVAQRCQLNGGSEKVLILVME